MTECRVPASGIRLERPVDEVLDALAAQDILGGYNLSKDYPELGDVLLVCATETKTQADIDTYVAALRDILSKTTKRSA